MTTTPGQVAYEAHNYTAAVTNGTTWDQLPSDSKHRWENIAAAVIDARLYRPPADGGIDDDHWAGTLTPEEARHMLNFLQGWTPDGFRAARASVETSRRDEAGEDQ